MLELLRDVGKHFTVNEMVAKESVRSRVEHPEQPKDCGYLTAPAGQT